jgi:hypothetical protein
MVTVGVTRGRRDLAANCGWLVASAWSASFLVLPVLFEVAIGSVLVTTGRPPPAAFRPSC